MQMYRDIKNILEKLKIEQEKINFHNQLKPIIWLNKGI